MRFLSGVEARYIAPSSATSMVISNHHMCEKVITTYVKRHLKLPRYGGCR
jgi:hypothetical protein